MRYTNVVLSGLCVMAASVSFAPTARADELYQSQQFRVNSFYDSAAATTIQSTLRAVSTHGYFYVDDRHWSSLSPDQQNQFTVALQALAQQFDGTIYPMSVALWGSEANPGVDGDSRVVIVLEKLIAGSGGYFETIHNYTKDRAPNGNAREMIFVNVESVVSGSARTFIAHEFQHLISFHQRELTNQAVEDIWLNEARSEYNVTAVGFSTPFEASTLQRRAQAFLRNPSDSLTDWPNTGLDYAISSLFIHYLADRYGNDVVAATIHSPLAGVSAIDEWLAAHTPDRFAEVFVDWMIAAYINNRSLDPAYGYARQGLSSLRVQPTVSGQLVGDNSQVVFSALLKEWQPLWTSANVNLSSVTVTDANVRISGSADVSWYGALIARYQNGTLRLLPFATTDGVATVSVPLRLEGAELLQLNVAVTQGRVASTAGRAMLERTVTIAMALGAVAEVTVPAQTPMPVATDTRFMPVRDGDLIRRVGQEEIYVVWGTYRRFLTREILELYGFQDRSVREVSDDLFFRYSASIYIRAQGAKQVYAVWPDGTKHWFDITAAQWDASGRDWGAIFTVNDAEVAAYDLGASITR